jgi:hypothetical protein
MFRIIQDRTTFLTISLFCKTPSTIVLSYVGQLLLGAMTLTSCRNDIQSRRALQLLLRVFIFHYCHFSLTSYCCNASHTLIALTCTLALFVLQSPQVNRDSVDAVDRCSTAPYIYVCVCVCLASLLPLERFLACQLTRSDKFGKTHKEGGTTTSKGHTYHLQDDFRMRPRRTKVQIYIYIYISLSSRNYLHDGDLQVALSPVVGRRDAELQSCRRCETSLL